MKEFILKNNKKRMGSLLTKLTLKPFIFTYLFFYSIFNPSLLFALGSPL